MAGPYAHLTLLHELANSLDASPGAPLAEIASAVQKRTFPSAPWARSALISPICRRTRPASPGATPCTTSTAGRSSSVAYRTSGRRPAELRPKLLAWLLGYCAHVVSDLTIHPVVAIKVGEYTENRRSHRICEMNQDTHIFSRMNLGEIRDTDRFTRDILACQERDSGRLDGNLAAMWDSLLRDTHPGMYATSRPSVQEWFSRFNALASSPVGHLGRLFPLAALISADMGRPYPLQEMVEQDYLHDLTVPGGRVMAYDRIFEAALENVRKLWGVVGEGVAASGDRFLSCIGNWNLDTGQDQEGRFVFWDSPKSPQEYIGQ
jgi:hypothetical protein